MTRRVLMAATYWFLAVAVFSYGRTCIVAIGFAILCLAIRWHLYERDRARGSAPARLSGEGSRRLPLSGPSPRPSRSRNHPVFGMSDDDAYRVDPTGDLG